MFFRRLAILASLVFFVLAAFSQEAAQPAQPVSPFSVSTPSLESAASALKSAKATLDAAIAGYEAMLAAEAAKVIVADTVAAVPAVKEDTVAAKAPAVPAAPVVVKPPVPAPPAVQPAVKDTAAAKVPVVPAPPAVAQPVVRDTVIAAVPVDSAAAVDTVAVKPDVADTSAIVAVPADSAVAADTAAPPAPKVVVAPQPPKTYPISLPVIDMVFVKGGRFRMGCQSGDVGCLDDERPVHEVKLGNYYIGKHLITQKQWKSVMGVNPSHFEGDDLPVEQVSWNEVQEFINRLNAMTGRKFRLPTEAEWEYAARGGVYGKGEKFHGQKFLDDIAWHDYNSSGTTHPVCSKAPNELNLCDMTGNVWEWVDDRYDRYYYRTSEIKNPKGPKHGPQRVYRGSSFKSEEQFCRISLRNHGKPEHRAIDLGFRLVRMP